MTVAIPDRRPIQGVLQILRFNWPYYAGSVSVLIVATSLLTLRTWPRPLELLGWLVCAAVAWWTAASLAASHWVYDRSALMTWRWVPELLPKRPRCWVNLHSGLDESTETLRSQLPDSTGVSLDIFDEREMSEASIRRARRQASHGTNAYAGHSALPLSDSSMDAVFSFFAAHELRAPLSRERLFGEVARILVPDGRMLLAEHPRDIANLVMFGPGFLHFLPRAEWLRLAAASGLKIERELTITPLVHVWSFVKGPAA